MKQSPTSRTLQRLKQLGFVAGVVERRNPKMIHVTHDLLGFADVFACRPGVGVLLIQCCAGASHAARKAKILAEPRAEVAARSGVNVELWSWSKQGGRDARKLWTLRREGLNSDLGTGR